MLVMLVMVASTVVVEGWRGDSGGGSERGDGGRGGIGGGGDGMAAAEGSYMCMSMIMNKQLQIHPNLRTNDFLIFS